MSVFRFKRKPKISSVYAASPKEIRAGLQEYLDYWNRRILAGDPLFDQWMVDTYNATKEALAAMDKMEDAGIETGKGEIVSTLDKEPSEIILEVEKFHDTLFFYRMITVFNGIRSESSGTASNEKEAIEEVHTLAERRHPSVAVKFKGVKSAA